MAEAARSSPVAPAKFSESRYLQNLGRLTTEQSFSVVTSEWPVIRQPGRWRDKQSLHSRSMRFQGEL